MIEKRCFAIRRGRCSVLNVKRCNDIECSFFKTKEQYKEDQQKSIERIETLDKATRRHITETYYGGKLGVMK